MWSWFKRAVVASVHEETDAPEHDAAPYDDILELTEIIRDDD